MKRVVCFSGGHSSGLVAIEVVRRYGKENVVLLNHDIHPGRELLDIKRFKKELSEYLDVPITYANINDIEDPNELPDQFDVCMETGTLTDPKTQQALCTSRLKTEPFERHLQKYYHKRDNLFGEDYTCVVYYGFDKNEAKRINRRYAVVAAMGFMTDFPLALWNDRTIESTREIGIDPPATYEVFEHANCVGCLKAGLLHWYVTYFWYPDIYSKAEAMEAKLNFAIHVVTRDKKPQPVFLKDLRSFFQKMKEDGVPPNEHQSKLKFAGFLRKYHLEEKNAGMPCECVI